VIILDTNVVSEPLKPAPSPRVLRWLNEQAHQTLYLTSINLAELLAGLAAMPAGRRQRELQQAFETKMLPLFRGRVLAFDEQAAAAFAVVTSRCQAGGKTMGFADASIAAIALARGYTLATHNIRDFQDCGVALIDPWAPGVAS
jgi:toxin FitB